MYMSARVRLGVAAITVASLGLVSGGLSPAVGSGTSARLAPTPKLSITITKTDFTVKGPHRFRAGRVAIAVTGKGPGGSAAFIRLREGYTFKEFKADVLASFVPGPDGLKALNRAIRHTKFFGGLAAHGGDTVTGTVVLPRAGRYIVYKFSDAGPANPVRLRVTGPAVRRAVPDSDGRAVAKTGARWGGSKTLPHRGTLTFKNAATDSPHFLILQHVAKGTTRQQVIDCVNDENCQFEFGREGSLETEVLSPGKSMTANYRLPRGTYVEMCFFPDPVTGMPHALMGMVRIVTLN